MEARVYLLPDPEPPPNPRLQAELDAEVGRLIAGKPGESEMDFIYRTRPGPVTQRWAILDLSLRRLGPAIKKYMPGVIELSVICTRFQVTMELAYAPRMDELKYGAVAQRIIHLPITTKDLADPSLCIGHTS